MYRVQLQQFEGPLDLLLFFIRRDELDIYDIPIARITDEYLGYVRLIEEIDLDGAADFIFMAALLISIKAAMLLPRSDVDEEGEIVDPRRELVDRLLEYIRYKEAAQVLEVAREQRRAHFTRQEATLPEPLADSEATLAVTLFDLVGALRRILTDAPAEPVHGVTRVEYTVEEQQNYVLAKLTERRKRSFHDLVANRPKAFVIATFLAVLELARLARIRLLSGSESQGFLIQLTTDPGGSAADGAAVNGANHPAGP
jgi:segregation and condensation protein A